MTLNPSIPKGQNMGEKTKFIFGSKIFNVKTEEAAQYVLSSCPMEKNFSVSIQVRSPLQHN